MNSYRIETDIRSLATLFHLAQLTEDRTVTERMALRRCFWDLREAGYLREMQSKPQVQFGEVCEACRLPLGEEWDYDTYHSISEEAAQQMDETGHLEPGHYHAWCCPECESTIEERTYEDG